LCDGYIARVERHRGRSRVPIRVRCYLYCATRLCAHLPIFIHDAIYLPPYGVVGVRQRVAGVHVTLDAVGLETCVYLFPRRRDGLRRATPGDDNVALVEDGRARVIIAVKRNTQTGKQFGIVLRADGVILCEFVNVDEILKVVVRHNILHGGVKYVHVVVQIKQYAQTEVNAKLRVLHAGRAYAYALSGFEQQQGASRVTYTQRCRGKYRRSEICAGHSCESNQIEFHVKRGRHDHVDDAHFGTRDREETRVRVYIDFVPATAVGGKNLNARVPACTR